MLLLPFWFQPPLSVVAFLVALGSAGLVAGGCGNSSPAAEATDASGAVVELGTGITAFEPLTAGQLLPLVQGPQGGHHFHFYVRMRGFSPGDPRTPGATTNPATAFSVFLPSGDRIDPVQPPYRIGYREAAEGFFELPFGLQHLVLQDRVMDALSDRVLVKVELQGSDGYTASDQVWVRAHEIPYEPDAGSPDAGSPDAGSLDADSTGQ